jgi:mono/diheme cytochrome c family protein
VLREDLTDAADNPIRARDLTAVPYKAGHAEADVALRIVRGVPGAPMPAFTGTLSPEDLWSTAAYVRSLQKR